ncbi:sugar transferase [Alicycliphilus sp. B1]|nr:sugar transferase [Alicycliphilus sp. B1]
MRVARGIQNKILEAMAMQQPVVTVTSCADAIGATAEQGVLRADAPEEFVQVLQSLLESPTSVAELGRKARSYVEHACSWQAHLGTIDSCLGNAGAAMPVVPEHEDARMTGSIRSIPAHWRRPWLHLYCCRLQSWPSIGIRPGAWP